MPPKVTNMIVPQAEKAWARARIHTLRIAAMVTERRWPLCSRRAGKPLTKMRYVPADCGG
jgi:hypothetical protein